VVSRAYYAAYNVSVELLERLCQSEGVNLRVEKQASFHGKLRAILVNSGDAELRKAGEKLNELRLWRNQADYEYDDLLHDTPVRVTAALTAADGIIRRLDEFSGTPGSRRREAARRMQEYQSR